MKLRLLAEGLRNTISSARSCFDHAVSRIGSGCLEYFSDDFQAPSLVLAMVDHNIRALALILDYVKARAELTPAQPHAGNGLDPCASGADVSGPLREFVRGHQSCTTGGWSKFWHPRCSPAPLGVEGVERSFPMFVGHVGKGIFQAHVMRAVELPCQAPPKLSRCAQQSSRTALRENLCHCF